MGKRRGAEYWQQHLDAWYQGDLTQEAYCIQHGLSEKTFYRWRRKEKDAKDAGIPSLTLVPVRVAAPTADNVIRLHSPSGWRIELPVGGATWLADLLRQLP